jgi:hypothetical protein
MDFLNKLQSVRDQIKPVIVKLEDLGVDVEIIQPFLSQRIALIQNESAKDKKNYSFLVVANCLSEKGVRQIDVLGYEEIAHGLDVLSETDLLNLFTECEKLSKTSIKDVEDAKKN